MGRDKKRYKNLLTDKIGKQTKLNPKITKEVANNIKSLDELKDIKYLLSKRVGAPFCTNVLRVALNFSEEKVASTLVSYYKVSLDEKMIIRAVKTNQTDFLYCIWAFNKNYERVG